MAFLKAALASTVMAVVLAGCFSPSHPPCAFSCAEDGICPSGYSCQADGVCHRDDGQGTCNIPSQIDAGDAGASDDAGDASAF